MQTFNLTSINSKSTPQPNRKKPYSGSANSKRSSSTLEAPGPFTKNILLLQRSIEEYTKKNDEIRETINLLNGAMETMDDRRLLFKEFDRDLNQIYDRLDRRFKDLEFAENLVYSFKQDLEGHSLYEKVPNLPTNENRKKLLEDNQQLVHTALAQEREMILKKMRLRLNHDHRDLSRLRRILNKLQGGGSDYREDEEITTELKNSIHILKDSIIRERERIRLLELPGMEEHDAALIIQKHVRGFLYRLKYCSKQKQLLSSRNENEEEDVNEESVNNEDEEINNSESVSQPRPSEAPAPAANDES